jgi:hypothetical protein
MPTWAWLLIVALLLFIWYLWSQYGEMYAAIKGNPGAVGAGQSVARYVTDITGLINAFESASDENGGFMSRLGAFFGALPK